MFAHVFMANGGGGGPIIHRYCSRGRKVLVGGKCGGSGGIGGSTSMTSTSGGVCLDGCVGAEGGVVRGGGVVLGVVSGGICEVTCGASGDLGGDFNGVEGGAML
ncbi:hypothetical protein Tco_0428268 [Tanacetum coccineum]